MAEFDIHLQLSATRVPNFSISNRFVQLCVGPTADVWKPNRRELAEGLVKQKSRARS